MVSDKEKAKTSKGASKKKKSTFNWSKAFIVFILVMVLFGMIAAWVSMGNNFNPTTTSSNSSIVSSFNSIADSLNIIPTGATYVRYSDFKDDPLLGEYLNGYYGNTLPNYPTFGANVTKDTLGIYPAGYFGDLEASSAGSVISLTEFDNATLNQSYPTVDNNYISGYTIPMSEVASNYYFTPKTSPVVSGTLNATTAVLATMTGEAEFNTSMDDYSGLFNEINMAHVPVDNMTLEAVGDNANFTMSGINLSIEQFYAATGPTSQVVVINNTSYATYDYAAVLLVNQTPSSNDIQSLYLLSGSNEKMGFSDYNVSVYGDYIVLQAHAPLGICIEDMAAWGFLKYPAGS
jgi:hypothetical protein